ncbi:MAG: ABC transporter ATP-binding protein, partial [Rubrobacter sp.]|nr:ABC transporter ATP-binding protein [Rubrobacter sp.]
ISPEVLEFRATPEALERIARRVANTADGVDHLGETLIVYTADSDIVAQKVKESGVPVDNTLYRQATLEDVFLKLAGRRLVD